MRASCVSGQASLPDALQGVYTGAITQGRLHRGRSSQAECSRGRPRLLAWLLIEVKTSVTTAQDRSGEGPDSIEIGRPDDWHMHFRDGAALALTVPHAARRFARAIAMPNLVPPVVSTDQALAYRQRILDACPPDLDFQPLMTLYLTDETGPDEILKAQRSGHVHAVKLYPAGATTNSSSGVTDVAARGAVFEAMQRVGMPLLVHGEVTDPEVDVFDREAVFIERVLAPLAERHPQLKIVFEHITTADAVDFVERARDGVAATITAHHLLINRNAIFQGGLRPHAYCLPVAKRERHRRALVRAATGGSPRYFLGTDSAPHPRGDKESACGCAGIYTGHAGIELYAECFAAVGALDRLQGFACEHGADFYGLPRNPGRLRLRRRAWVVDTQYRTSADDADSLEVVPFRAGQDVGWCIDDEPDPLRST
ncbi:MAG: dihydroorotase [Gammaproteobacteria bacterium]|nr:dihydroorotase [Gammaproteobacteria bacterium]